jgi:hypothetical protein
MTLSGRMEDPKVPKKRGRKPKVQTEQTSQEDEDEESSVQIENDGEPRKRKRGRKPKCEIKSIQDIRQKFNNSDDKVIFQGSNEPIETDLMQVQVPFGNLNIVVHSAKPVDKDELRNMFSKQITEPAVKVVEKKKYVESSRNLSSNESESESENDSIYNRRYLRTAKPMALRIGAKFIEEDTAQVAASLEERMTSGQSDALRRMTSGQSDALRRMTQCAASVEEKAPSTPKTLVDTAEQYSVDNVEIVQKNKIKINRLLYKFVNKLDETKEWPTKCNTLCWWCCHGFESIPIPCVSKYDSIRKRFKIYGIFCSWNCSAAHAMKENDSILNLQLLKREWTGDTSNIERSPSRYILKAFGGHMSIEEYRNNNGVQRTFHITKNNMDFINHNCIESYTETSKKVKSKYKLKRKNNNITSTPLFETCLVDYSAQSAE